MRGDHSWPSKFQVVGSSNTIVAGVMSTAGYVFLSPAVERRLGVADTCGVVNLHGFPGVLGALASALFAAFYFQANASLIPHAGWQPVYQLGGLAATLSSALAGGLVAGFLVTRVGKGKQELAEGDFYEDAVFWEDVEH